MRRNIGLWFMLLIPALLSPGAGAAGDGDATPSVPRRVKVLFLGDNAHHRPLERCRQVFSAMARRGVDFTYTDSPADLEPANLGRYDCLLVYANIAAVSAEQERAVLGFVASGKGFVPVHSASDCFAKNPELAKLIGGRFKSHGAGVFRETIVQPDHPAVEMLKPIESWDESYVHADHNEQNREVLAVREEGDRREPYTWVRTHGKGRVFYTAWGHDQRTWGNGDFQNLLERGVRWAAGDWALRPAPARQPFKYAKANLPNYLPDQPWGTQGEAITRMQLPVDPAESVRHMVLPPGFRAELFAAEPDIYKPVCMTWDERGRLWVAETVDYPNDMQPEGKGRDQIKVCEDTDGDGRADKFTVFADKLSIPTSILCANGGLIVAQAPHMLFLKDTDGDGQADERRVLFSGWGIEDTHAGPSNLRYGFDNWIYGTVGYSGFNGTIGGQALRFGQGLFRFRPDGTKLEFLGSTNNNTWGLGFSEEGLIFGSTANRNPSFHLHIPNRYYEQVRGMSPGVLPPMADTSNFYAVTDKVRQMDHHGHYTAAAGHALYTARQYPPQYWNRVAFVTEPTGHIVGQFVIERRGGGTEFAARNDFNFLGSGDEWTSPIAAEVGPDGSVWVVDWYNYVIQHNPIPAGFEKGKGNAYVTPLRDKTHGRIYRIVYGEGAPAKVPNLSKATGEELVGALGNDNLFWRQTAQRLLVERGDRGVVQSLIREALTRTKDDIGISGQVIHALWALHGLGILDGSDGEATAVARQALGLKSAAVRKTTLEVLPRTADAVATILGGNLLADRDPLVRKAALLALSEMPPSDEAGAAVFAALRNPENAQDRWIPDAAAIAAARHDAGFLRAAFAAYQRKGGAAPNASAGPANLLPNPSFEDADGERPRGWQPRNWGGQPGVHEWVAGGRTGGRCVKISSERGSDTTWSVEVPVEPNAQYRLSGWVKTKGVRNVAGGMGALLNVHEVQPQGKTAAVAGDQADWERVECVFDTGNRKSVMVNCLFGGWGQSAGVAWYDDLELVRVGAPPLPGVEGKVIGIVAGHYASRGPVDSIMDTLAALKDSDPALATAVIEGFAAGWPEGKAPQIDSPKGKLEWDRQQSVLWSLPEEAQVKLLVLTDRWGRRDLFAHQIRDLGRRLGARLADPTLDEASRLHTARLMVEAEPTSSGVLDRILKEITPQAPPEFQIGLIEAVGTSNTEGAGRKLIERWKTISPSAQRAALAVMLRRELWSRSLLDAVEAGTVGNRDLAAEHWQLLTALPDRPTAERAAKLQKMAGRTPGADRQQVVDKLLPLAQEKGDATRGAEVFAKNCLVCHALDGQGGKVGPDLTGVGAKLRSEILLDVIDPNRSVEGTYRQWMAQTKKEVIAGRLAAESRTSVEILDTAGKSHVVQREDIKRLQASDRSVMPEGFENLPPGDLTALLEYLAASKVKH